MGNDTLASLVTLDQLRRRIRTDVRDLIDALLLVAPLAPGGLESITLAMQERANMVRDIGQEVDSVLKQVIDEVAKEARIS